MIVYQFDINKKIHINVYRHWTKVKPTKSFPLASRFTAELFSTLRDYNIKVKS